MFGFLLTCNSSEVVIDSKVFFTKKIPSTDPRLGNPEFLFNLKNQIFKDYSIARWDALRKKNYKYEFLKKELKSVQVISRAFFKMWECIILFDLIGESSNFKSASICEGPGGFMQAMEYFCKKNNIRGEFHGITLKQASTNFKCKQYPNFQIHYGHDSSGNIFKLDNIKCFRNVVGKVGLVTGDGGFDFNKISSFNEQEQSMHRLLFCQITTALSVCETQGHFVLKIFDTYTSFTVKLIYLLTKLFNQTFINKLSTSRPANCERYLICKYFKGISEYNLNQLYTIVNKWRDTYYVDLSKCDFLEVPDSFITQLNTINTDFSNFQIKSIQAVILNEPGIDHSKEWLTRFELLRNPL